MLVLSKVKEILLSNELKDEKIRIEGHTDWIGTESYNQVLSVNRATSVSNWFIKNSIAKNRVIVSGFGENVPIDTNTTKEGRQNNRRVEIVVERSS